MALGIPMALLASSLISGGAGVLGNVLGNKEQPQTGYDIVEMPQYPWAEGTQEGVNQYYMNMLDSIQRGEAPTWVSNYLNPMRQSAQQNLYGNVYGTAGRPGTLRDIMGAGSITGVGSKAAMTKANQHLTDYLSESDKIDQYFNSLGFNYMSNASMQVPQAAASMARGPETQIVNYMGGVGTGNQQTDLGQLAGNIPWEKMFTSGNNPSSYTPMTYANSVTSPSQYSYIPSEFDYRNPSNYTLGGR